MTISNEMRAFKDALQRQDSDFCLTMLDKNPALAIKIEKNGFDLVETPLVMAMRQGNATVVDRVLQLGAKMNIVHGAGNDRDTAMTLVLDHSRGDKIPNRLEVRDVLVKHYADRQASQEGKNLLDNLKAGAGELFKKFMERVDGVVRNEAFGLAALAAPGAALGSVLGVSAASAALAPAAGTVVLGASAAGLGLFALHKVRDHLGMDHLSREQQYAEKSFQELIANRVPQAVEQPIQRTQEVHQELLVPTRPIEMSLSQIDETLELFSLVDAEKYADRIGAPAKRADVDKGRYTGRILFSSDHHVVQDNGRGQVVIHDKAKLDINSAEPLVPGKMMKIVYSGSRGQEIQSNDKGKDTGRTR
jgi:hypothetical protein